MKLHELKSPPGSVCAVREAVLQSSGEAEMLPGRLFPNSEPVNRDVKAVPGSERLCQLLVACVCAARCGGLGWKCSLSNVLNFQTPLLQPHWSTLGFAFQERALLAGIPTDCGAGGVCSITHMHGVCPGLLCPQRVVHPARKKRFCCQRDAAGRAVNLPHLPCFIPLLRSPEGEEVPRLEKPLGGQTWVIETVSGSHWGRSLPAVSPASVFTG